MVDRTHGPESTCDHYHVLYNLINVHSIHFALLLSSITLTLSYWHCIYPMKSHSSNTPTSIGPTNRVAAGHPSTAVPDSTDEEEAGERDHSVLVPAISPQSSMGFTARTTVAASTDTDVAAEASVDIAAPSMVVTRELGVDNQLLGGLDLYKPSKHWYPSCTALSASSGKWGSLGSSDHPTTEHFGSAVLATT